MAAAVPDTVLYRPHEEVTDNSPRPSLDSPDIAMQTPDTKSFNPGQKSGRRLVRAGHALEQEIPGSPHRNAEDFTLQAQPGSQAKQQEIVDSRDPDDPSLSQIIRPARSSTSHSESDKFAAARTSTASVAPLSLEKKGKRESESSTPSKPALSSRKKARITTFTSTNRKLAPKMPSNYLHDSSHEVTTAPDRDLARTSYSLNVDRGSLGPSPATEHATPGDPLHPYHGPEVPTTIEGHIEDSTSSEKQRRQTTNIRVNSTRVTNGQMRPLMYDPVRDNVVPRHSARERYAKSNRKVHRSSVPSRSDDRQPSRESVVLQSSGITQRQRQRHVPRSAPTPRSRNGIDPHQEHALDVDFASLGDPSADLSDGHPAHDARN